MLLTSLEHRFMSVIPEELEPGILYVSMEYATAAHSCCCGCGEEIVTPFTPTDWRMQFDGETISLNPSVGSWTLPCRSHYVIKRGKVIEAGPWSDEKIQAERHRDKRAKQQYYGEIKATTAPQSTQERKPKLKPEGLIAHLKKWLGF